MKNKELNDLKDDLAKFASDRDWDKFHSPKNLAMALSGEAGELADVFQWLTEEESKSLTDKQRGRAAEEMADVFMYLLRMSDKLDIDLIEAAHKKLAINAEKYPVERCYGIAKKYNEL
ncbi:nucleotide pyrophosphohydrolase [Vibrio fortis]|uniref:Nucleotide pyrophosphohydrolase n=1 Tax=Vibrio fortis TaxID=212667 RepID=A0A5N3S2D8_9VIBR|nr:nucleotide pyrophosphohydrolase [Vibrio fortis]KAB0300697.1 nucleotide pyrophosphohydrolase [Vibrio fortis]